MVLIWMSARRSRIAAQRRAIERRLLGGAPQLADDALAHLRRRLPRERDRQDVRRIDAARQQVHVARDEDARLARPGRRLEDDVVARDRARTRAPRRRDPRSPAIAVASASPPNERHLIASLLITRRRRSPCGTRPGTRTSCRGTARRAGPGTRRARSRRRPSAASPALRRAPSPGSAARLNGGLLLERDVAGARRPSRSARAGPSSACCAHDAVDRQLQRRASSPARGRSCSPRCGACRPASRSMRSAFDRSVTCRVAPPAANVKVPSSWYSSRRSTTGIAVLDLEREGALAEPGRGRRAEEQRALQRAIPFGQLREVPLGDGVEQRDRLGDVRRRDRAVAEPLPLARRSSRTPRGRSGRAPAASSTPVRRAPRAA